MANAIRKRLKDFVAIIVLVGIAAAITLYILANQSLNAPAWVPVLGKETFELKAQFSTAQAVTPGQGQTVNIAGVPIGQVRTAELVGGRAVVTMDLETKYRGRIFPNATMLLRPKTGLKDMVIALDPGNSSGGEALQEGDVLPVSRTAPDVNFEEFLSVLDADTRDYLVMLLNGGAQGLARNGRTLAQILRQLDPFQRNIAKINSQLQKRQANMKRVTTNLNLLLNELGSRDTQLAAFVKSSNESFSNFAAQKENIKETISLLPGALNATNNAMKAVYANSEIAGPTLAGLLPTAKGLAPAQVAGQQFFNTTKPVIKDQLRPFAVEARPGIDLLNSASINLAKAGPGLEKTFNSLNYGTNTLAYDPAGDVPPYLFYLFWAGHNVNSTLGNQDAGGAVRQATLFSSEGAFGFAYQIVGDVCAAGNPSLKVILGLTRAPAVGSGANCPAP